MASYAAIASLVELLNDILHRSRDPNLLHETHKTTLTSLLQKSILLFELLQDYSSKGDQIADRLERRIRVAAYKAQDILESQIIEQIDAKSGFTTKNRCEEDDELQKVGQEVDSIAEDVKAIKESQAREDLHADYVSSEQKLETGKNTMVGFEDYLNAVRAEVCGESTQLQGISIAGITKIDELPEEENDTMGDSEEKDENEVETEETFALYEQLKKMLETGDDKLKKEVEEMEKRLRKKAEIEKKRRRRREELEKKRRRKETALKVQIYKYLTGQKFFVVIDDVWNKKVWDDLKHIFPSENTGSRILLTTRLKNVAEYPDIPNFLHEMHSLSPESSWDLLRRKVFGEGDCPLELVNTGRSIASRCGGLPLALVVIAGILSGDTTPGNWEKIARNVDSVLSKDDERVLDILSLSYNHLPSRLKACFLLMGSFPEDYEISIPKLIRLWIAEGFLKSANGAKSLEKVGEEYLDDLVKRSLVMVMKRSANGQFKTCVLHDRLRDLCQQKGASECFFHDKDRTNSSGVEKARRVILDPHSPIMPWEHDDGRYVRSVCWFCKTTDSNVHGLDWSRVKLLRILDVADIETPVAPLTVSWMLHLKYLALRLATRKKRSLPPSISKFQNLQTINIHAPQSASVSLPSEIWTMTQLRHVIIDRVTLPPAPSRGDIPLQKLEHLQTLETVENFEFTNEATRMIPNIRKLKLSCRGAEASGIWKQYCLENLVSLLRLEKLNIVFDAAHSSYIDSFQSSFVFPQNLTKLSLQGCRLPWEELTTVGSLKLLEVLRLRKDALVGEEWEPKDDQFLKLRFLLMESLDLVQWKADRDHFPRLEHLRIMECSELEEIPLNFGDIPTLKSIKVQFSQRAGNSAIEILNDQRSYDNNKLQVDVRD
ncbi:late blight resistance protein R1-A-like [Andrographis paniculata]|uniref:late blight resistance protein R1-A-like n=1 Tax=Andrographis paniculata TaxID=175694 RepID=UPI0021E7B781|nr:late blight resistance protein R1-A-like [Andrographis paniculata]